MVPIAVNLTACWINIVLSSRRIDVMERALREADKAHGFMKGM